MADPKTSDQNAKPVSQLGSELWGLVLAYLRQETVDPLKNLVRYVAFGLAGAVCFALGGGLAALAAVRALQGELANRTHPALSGNLSWVPYLGGVVMSGGLAIWAVSRITKRSN